MAAQQNKTEDFSLSKGGPFYRGLMRLHLHDQPKKLVTFYLCIAWLPLLILTAFEKKLYSGTELPFLQDISMQVRLLIAGPILLLIQKAIDEKVIIVLTSITDSLLETEERKIIINKTIHRINRLTNSTAVEIILLLFVISVPISVVRNGFFSGFEDLVNTWMATGAEKKQLLTLAGDWAAFVSLPLFQFLLLRWFWRYFVWILLLFKLSKSNLNLLPTHADRSGGLGNIILAQKMFCLIFVAGSVVISGHFIEQLLGNPEIFNSLRAEVVGYVILSLILLILPLIFFVSKLIDTKNNALVHLSNLGAILSRKFEKEWVNDSQIEKKMGEEQIDPSLIYDYLGIFDALQQLRTIPVAPRDIISMAVILFVPFIPILFIHFSVSELLQKIVGLLA